MSGKLDQSLDQILETRKKTARGRGRGGRRVGTTRKPTVAPTGGIQKKTRASNTANAVVVPTGPIGGAGESKIIVSGLPSDVTEQQIKEYFAKSVGPVKRAMLTYGPNGVSRGVSTIIFSKPGSAAKALDSLNGVKVDNRPMRIEIIVNAKAAQAAAPAKGLGDRVVKDQPKSAAPKAATNGTTSTRGRGKAGAGRGPRRGRNANRAKPKTADELDAEMVDYFDANAQNAGTEGAAANGAVADGGLDEIS